jgi:hypothetical protein
MPAKWRKIVQPRDSHRVTEWEPDLSAVLIGRWRPLVQHHNQ